MSRTEATDAMSGKQPDSTSLAQGIPVSDRAATLIQKDTARLQEPKLHTEVGWQAEPLLPGPFVGVRVHHPRDSTFVSCRPA